MRRLSYLLAMLAAAFMARAVHAATSVQFDSPTSCLNYCTGYTTYSPVHTVGSVSITVASGNVYKVTVRYDGLDYSGSALMFPITPTSSNPYYATITGAVLELAGHPPLTFDAVVLVRWKAVSSGRAHYRIYYRWAQSGTVTQ